MKKQLLISTMALTAIALGCRKESPPPRQTTLQQVSNPKNPYSLANMRKALADLSFDGNLEKANSNIKATHYYLKFMPRTDAELELLKADTALVLYPFPIDTEDDPANGRNYRDPTIPIGQPTYQYAAVPISKVYPMCLM